MSNIKQFFFKNKEKLIFVVFFIVSFLISYFSNYKDGGDDLFYKNSALNYQAGNFVVTRYFDWTGRIIPELLAYFFDGSLAFMWPLLNAAIITLLSVLIFKYVNLFKNLKSNKKILLILIICLSFLLINKSVMEPAFVWRTGSINYLWPATLGFLAFYPFLKSTKNKLNKKSYWFYFLISFLAAISTEQVSVALILGAVTYFGYMLINKNKIPKILYFMSLNILIGSFLLFLAPGNKIRFQIEAAHNFPDFLNLGIFNRISISLYWVINKFVNVLPLVLAPIYLILGYKKNKVAFILGIILVIKGVFGIEYKIYPITSDNVFSLGILITYFLVLLGLFIIPFLIWQLFKMSKKTLFYFLILLTVIILMLMVTLSPTLDVSGNRTVFLPSVLINVLSLLLIVELI